VVRSEDADQLQLRRAGHADDLGAGRRGDLHGERPHAAGRADDQHLLPGLDVPAVADRRVQAQDHAHGGRLTGP
jgi:hypothetical protein